MKSRTPRRRSESKSALSRKRPGNAAPADSTLVDSAESSALDGLLDEVKATTIALLAGLREKERELRDRGAEQPLPGVSRGLSDITALRRWADRTLNTIEALEEHGRTHGEIHELIDELGEFRTILRERQPLVPSEPPGVPSA